MQSAGTAVTRTENKFPAQDLKRQVPTTIGQKKETPITFPLQKLFGDKKKLTAEDMFKLAQGQGANELKGDDAAALAAHVRAPGPR